jgi:hypothetical protein
MPNDMTPEEVKELEHLDSILTSPGLKYIKNLLHAHHLHCITQSHQCLEKFEDRKAGEWLAKSKEPNTILNMIIKRRNELQTKQTQVKEQ